MLVPLVLVQTGYSSATLGVETMTRGSFDIFKQCRHQDKDEWSVSLVTRAVLTVGICSTFRRPLTPASLSNAR